MKINLFVIFCYCTSLSLWSCKDEVVKNSFKGAKEIVIDVRNQTALPYDSIFSAISYIKLETTDDCLIGVITQVIFVDSMIVVVDKRYANSIYVFDNTGKFLHSIGRQGNGPNEYVDIEHVAYDQLNGKISIFDKGQNKIIHYKPDGDFLSSENTPFVMCSFEYLGNGAKAYYKSGISDQSLGNYSNNPLIVTDSLNKPLYGDCHVFDETGKFNYTMAKSLGIFGDEVIFSPDFSNVVYTVTDTKVIPKYHINIAWQGMPALNDEITDEIFNDYTSSLYYFNGDIIELKDFTYINIMSPKGYPFVLYSHNAKKTFFCNEQCSHPIHPFLISNPPIARHKDNSIVYSVSSDYLKINQQELHKFYPTHGEWLDVFYEELTEESNLILVFCQLNENL